MAGVSWGPWIAMAAAVVLTAKGEFDLAVLAHFSPKIAWMFPVMLDVYVITAFHRRRWADMVVGMLLMIFCQIAVHLVPVFITEGEEVPWGLVVAVACVAPIVVVRVKSLTGRTDQEVAAEAETARRAEELRAARAETAAARAAQAEAEATARAEAARAEAEAAARAEAETARAEAETRAGAEAETRAETLVAKEAEIATCAEAEISARADAEAAQRRAAEAIEAQRLAEGRLAEARDAADRAAAARTLAVQAADEQTRASVEAAEQAERGCQAAQDRAGEADEMVRELQAQLAEAQRFVEHQVTARVRAEQEAQALAEAREGVASELERVRRALARVQEKPEISSGRRTEITRPAGRKALAAVPAELPAGLPEVETVRAETVAVVLAARGRNPEMTNKQLAELTGISDRTIRKVLNAVPAEIAGQVLQLADGRVA